MENFREKYSSKSGMESEWKRNGTGKENKFQIYWSQYQLEWNRNGMEMEWKFHNKKSQCKIEWKWNGNRMVMKRKKNGQTYWK